MDDLKFKPFQKLEESPLKKEEKESLGFGSWLRGLFSKDTSKGLNVYGSPLKLAFVVGHESSAPGAYGVKPLSTSEYQWSKELSELVRRYAAKKGVEVKVFFRDGIGIKGAHRQANAWGAYCVIESHFNAFNGKAFGTMTLASPSMQGSKDFATIVQKHMCEVFKRTGSANRGVSLVKRSDRGGVNVNLYPRTVLIEPFFGDNAKDAALAVELKEELAECLVLAFMEYVS
jgi:N-acetylmuramoyl-L-alanine amidase